MVIRLAKKAGLRLAGTMLRACQESWDSNLQRIVGVTAAPSVVVHGRPIIDLRHGATLHIGEHVTLNSRNFGYHLNMHSPVKLYADRPGAAIVIGDRCRIHGSCIHAYASITIGDNCLIAANCQIIDGSGHSLSFDDVDNRINTTGESRPIVIEDSVWLGANTIVLPGVRIGRGSVVAAGSVVTKDIPAMVLAGGIPARTIRTAEEILSAGTEPGG